MDKYNLVKNINITNYLDLENQNNIDLPNIMQTEFFNRRLIYIPKKKLYIKKNYYKLFVEQCRSNGFEVINFNEKPTVITGYQDYPTESEVINAVSVKYIKIKYLDFIMISPKQKSHNVSIIYDVDPAFEELHFK